MYTNKVILCEMGKKRIFSITSIRVTKIAKIPTMILQYLK